MGPSTSSITSASRAGFFLPVDRRDVGVIERGQSASFPLEAGHALGILSEGLWEDFQRDVAAQLGTRGAIHPSPMPPAPSLAVTL